MTDEPRDDDWDDEFDLGTVNLERLGSAWAGECRELDERAVALAEAEPGDHGRAQIDELPRSRGRSFLRVAAAFLLGGLMVSAAWWANSEGIIPGSKQAETSVALVANSVVHWYESEPLLSGILIAVGSDDQRWSGELVQCQRVKEVGATAYECLPTGTQLAWEPSRRAPVDIRVIGLARDPSASFDESIRDALLTRLNEGRALPDSAQLLGTFRAVVIEDDGVWSWSIRPTNQAASVSLSPDRTTLVTEGRINDTIARMRIGFSQP